MGNQENLAELTFQRLLGEFAARTPTPGGGAAAGLTAAMGAALGAMAFRFSRKKDDRESELEAFAERLQEQAVQMAWAAEEDCRAYEEVRAAYRLPKEGEEQRSARSREIRRATLGAMASPLSLLERILEVVRLIGAKAGEVKPALASDLASAAWCLRAGAEMAWLNVRINGGALPGDQEAERVLEKGKDLREALLQLLEGILAQAEEAL